MQMTLELRLPQRHSVLLVLLGRSAGRREPQQQDSAAAAAAAVSGRLVESGEGQEHAAAALLHECCTSAARVLHECCTSADARLVGKLLGKPQARACRRQGACRSRPAGARGKMEVRVRVDGLGRGAIARDAAGREGRGRGRARGGVRV